MSNWVIQIVLLLKRSSWYVYHREVCTTGKQKIINVHGTGWPQKETLLSLKLSSVKMGLVFNLCPHTWMWPEQPQPRCLIESKPLPNTHWPTSSLLARACRHVPGYENGAVQVLVEAVCAPPSVRVCVCVRARSQRRRAPSASGLVPSPPSLQVPTRTHWDTGFQWALRDGSPAWTFWPGCDNAADR